VAVKALPNLTVSSIFVTPWKSYLCILRAANAPLGNRLSRLTRRRHLSRR